MLGSRNWQKNPWEEFYLAKLHVNRLLVVAARKSSRLFQQKYLANGFQSSKNIKIIQGTCKYIGVYISEGEAWEYAFQKVHEVTDER